MRRSVRWLAATVAAVGLPAAASGDQSGPKHWFEHGRREIARAQSLAPQTGNARNVILFVGDGMGVSTVTAARILDGQLRGGTGEENTLSFERLPYLAMAKTYNTNQQTPDSAGTMTALVAGAKTRAGVISLDERALRADVSDLENHRLTTILETAEERGLATGVVTTTTITHATPAACYAHSPERSWENDARLSVAAREAGVPDIARQLIEFSGGDGVDVALGGGREHFLPAGVPDPEYPERTGSRRDGRNLTEEWAARSEGAAYVWNREQLATLDPATTGAILGLFEPGHMQFETDRERDGAGEPSLSEMTAAAIAHLSRNPRGFFLAVEGGRIDHGHHVSNAHRALTDTIEFARAVRVAMEKTDPKDTLIVVTADHSHTLTIGGYPTRGNPILGKVIPNDDRGLPSARYEIGGLGLPFTTLGYQNGPGYTGASNVHSEGPKHLGEKHPNQWQGIEAGRPDLSDVDTTAPDYLQESTVPMRSETHGAEDVPIYAGGPGAHLFHGTHEQSYVYHVMMEAFGWNERQGWLDRLLD